MIDYFNKKANGLFPICITEVIIGLNWVLSLSGGNTYFDLYDNPESN